MKSFSLVVTVASLVFLGASANARDALAQTAGPAPRAPQNFAGVDLMGFAGFLRTNVGSFEVHYEHVFAGHHGVAAAFDFVHVHHAASYVQSHQWTFGGALTYRYYFDEGRGFFVGASVGYRRGFGHYEEPGRVLHVDLANEQLRVLAQTGYRFVVPTSAPSFSVVPRFGIGYGPYTVTAKNAPDAPTGDYVTRVSRDHLAPHALVIELELSLAVGF